MQRLAEEFVINKTLNFTAALMIFMRTNSNVWVWRAEGSDNKIILLLFKSSLFMSFSITIYLQETEFYICLNQQPHPLQQQHQ